MGMLQIDDRRLRGAAREAVVAMTPEAGGPATILVVEGTASGPDALAPLLQGAGLRALSASDETETLRLAARQPDVIVLGAGLADPVALCRRLKAEPASAAIPIVWRTDRPGDVTGVEVCLAAAAPVGELLAAVRAIVGVRRAEAARSERQRRELLEVQTLYRALVRHFPNGAVFLFDRDLRYLLAGGSGVLPAGRSPEELIGKTVTEALPPEIAPRVENLYREVLAGQEVRHEAHYQDRILMLHGVPIREAQGEIRAGLVITQDITESKRVEAELRRRGEQLAEADRRKDEFLAQLGHELRNPLAPLLNALHLLRLRADDAAAVQAARELAERQVRQLARLVDDLLDASRIALGKIRLHKEPVDAERLVGDAVEMARPLVEARRHQLTVLLPRGERLLLEADATRVVQVLTNLLTNAAKYTEPGGHIWLTAERDENDLLFRVRDTGVGLSAELLPRIFDPFVQAERGAQGGLGIGLSVVRGLVELHGGSVLALSDGPGEGSEFVVRLPALPPEQQAPAAAAPQASVGVNGPSLRVLIVDDDIDGAESLRLLLGLWNHQVQLAHDGVSALEVAHHWQPQVVLLDIGLPGGLDGYQVARCLRDEIGLTKATLLAMTGWGQEEDRKQSQAAGFDHHLVKPVDPAELQNLLARLGARSDPG